MIKQTLAPAMNRYFLAIWISISAGLGGMPAKADELYPEIVPDPVYEPHEVVGIQMRALGKNNIPFENAGIELTFRFASPGNRKNTGPVEKFATLFAIPAYRPMLDHSELLIGQVTLSDSTAFVPVKIRDKNGKQHGYLFQLSQQSEQPYENCWMTDSVIQMKIPAEDSVVM